MCIRDRSYSVSYVNGCQDVCKHISPSNPLTSLHATAQHPPTETKITINNSLHIKNNKIDLRLKRSTKHSNSFPNISDNFN